MSYETYKAIHILGVILFLGNIIITGVWKAFADRTGNPAIVAFGQRLVTITDWLFTAGGVGLVMIGFYGMGYGSAFLRFTEQPYWIQWGMGLFIASGVIWALILIPLQIIQARMARAFVPTEPVPKRYWRLNRQWFIWGIIAILLPLANLYWMVFKP